LLVEKVEKNRNANNSLKDRNSHRFLKIYNKLITALNIAVSQEVKEQCKAIFSILYEEGQKRSKYKQFDRLIPIVIYIVLKKKEDLMFVNLILLNIRELTKKNFSRSIRSIFF